MAITVEDLDALDTAPPMAVRAGPGAITVEALDALDGPAALSTRQFGQPHGRGSLMGVMTATPPRLQPDVAPDLPGPPVIGRNAEVPVPPPGTLGLRARAIPVPRPELPIPEIPLGAEAMMHGTPRTEATPDYPARVPELRAERPGGRPLFVPDTEPRVPDPTELARARLGLRPPLEYPVELPIGHSVIDLAAALPRAVVTLGRALEAIQGGASPEQVAASPAFAESMLLLSGATMPRSPGVRTEYGTALRPRTAIERAAGGERPGLGPEATAGLVETLAHPDFPVGSVERLAQSPRGDVAAAAREALGRRRAAPPSAPPPIAPPESPLPDPSGLLDRFRASRSEDLAAVQQRGAELAAELERVAPPTPDRLAQALTDLRGEVTQIREALRLPPGTAQAPPTARPTEPPVSPPVPTPDVTPLSAQVAPTEAPATSGERFAGMRGAQQGLATEGRQLEPGQTWMPPGEIVADPERFQWKRAGQETATGASGTFKRGERYDPAADPEGILVWRDPDTDQWAVIDGHNRLAKAKSQGEAQIKTRVLQAPTAEAAHTLWVIENLVRGNGTAQDAADFFREYRLGEAQLRAFGVDADLPVVREGLRLARPPAATPPTAGERFAARRATPEAPAGPTAEQTAELARLRAENAALRSQPPPQMVGPAEAAITVQAGGRPEQTLADTDRAELADLRAQIAEGAVGRRLFDRETGAFQQAQRSTYPRAMLDIAPTQAEALTAIDQALAGRGTAGAARAIAAARRQAETRPPMAEAPPARTGEVVRTPEGVGAVVESDPRMGTVAVKLDDDGTKLYSAEAVQPEEAFDFSAEAMAQHPPTKPIEEMTRAEYEQYVADAEGAGAFEPRVPYNRPVPGQRGPGASPPTPPPPPEPAGGIDEAALRASLGPGDRSRLPSDVPALRAEGTLVDYTDDRAFRDWLGYGTPFWDLGLYTRAKRGEAIPIYRAVPTTVTAIHPGAYVTQNRAYAEDHLRRQLRGQGHILTGSARADELSPVNPNEFWYVPESLRPSPPPSPSGEEPSSYRYEPTPEGEQARIPGTERRTIAPGPIRRAPTKPPLESGRSEENLFNAERKAEQREIEASQEDLFSGPATVETPPTPAPASREPTTPELVAIAREQVATVPEGLRASVRAGIERLEREPAEGVALDITPNMLEAIAHEGQPLFEAVERYVAPDERARATDALRDLAAVTGGPAGGGGPPDLRATRAVPGGAGARTLGLGITAPLAETGHLDLRGLPVGRGLPRHRVSESPDLHEQAIRRAIEEGRMTPERAEALGHFDAYPALRPVPPPSGGAAAGAELLTPPRRPADEAATGYAGSINLDRLDTTEDVKALYSRVHAEHEPLMTRRRRAPMTLADIDRQAQEMGMDEAALRSLVERVKLLPEEVTAARHFVLASSDRLHGLLDEYRTTRETGTTPDELVDRFAEAATHHVALLGDLMGVSSEIGRALSAHRLLATAGSSRPRRAQAVAQAIEALGGRERTRETMDRLLEVSRTDPLTLNRFLVNTQRPKFRDKVYEAWLASILSGPQTHAANILGTGLYLVQTTGEKMVAGGLDAVLAALSGRPRQVFGREAVADVAGMFTALRSGRALGRAAAAWLEHPDVGRTQVEHPPAIGGQRGAPAWEQRLGRGIRIPLRALSAEDAFLKALVWDAEIEAGALRVGLHERLHGEALAERVAALISDPTPAMLLRAEAQTDLRTFNAKLGTYGQKIMGLRDDTLFGFATKGVIPFIRTPTNLMKQAIRRTPLGFLQVGGRALQGAYRRGTEGEGLRHIPAGVETPPHVLAEDLTPPLVGSLLMLGFGTLVAAGFITGGGGTKQERKRKEETGWQAYSIYVPGFGYYSYRRIEPLGTLLGMAADVVELTRAGETEKASQVLTAAGESVTANLTDKTFFQSVLNLSKLLTDPARSGETWLEGQARGVVPMGGLLGTVAGGLDPMAREIEGLLAAMQARIPRFREQLPERLTSLGAVQESDEPAWSRVASPIRYRAEPAGRLAERELQRLGQSVGEPPKTLKVGDREVDLSWSERRRLKQHTGDRIRERLQDMIKRDWYQGLGRAEQKDEVEQVIREARKRAREAFLPTVRDRVGAGR